jgi:hypothetical protein
MFYYNLYFPNVKLISRILNFSKLNNNIFFCFHHLKTSTQTRDLLRKANHVSESWYNDIKCSHICTVLIGSYNYDKNILILVKFVHLSFVFLCIIKINLFVRRIYLKIDSHPFYNYIYIYIIIYLFF